MRLEPRTAVISAALFLGIALLLSFKALPEDAQPAVETAAPGWEWLTISHHTGWGRHGADGTYQPGSVMTVQVTRSSPEPFAVGGDERELSPWASEVIGFVSESDVEAEAVRVAEIREITGYVARESLRKRAQNAFSIVSDREQVDWFERYSATEGIAEGLHVEALRAGWEPLSHAESTRSESRPLRETVFYRRQVL